MDIIYERNEDKKSSVGLSRAVYSQMHIKILVYMHTCVCALAHVYTRRLQDWSCQMWWRRGHQPRAQCCCTLPSACTLMIIRTKYIGAFFYFFGPS